MTGRWFRPPGEASTDISDLQWEFLNDRVAEDDPRRTAPETKWRMYELVTNRKVGDIEARPCSDLWALYGAQVLARWVKDHPATRPSCWWRFEGPDGPDAMAGCVPPVRVQPRKLQALGVLTKAEAGWAVVVARSKRRSPEPVKTPVA